MSSAKGSTPRYALYLAKTSELPERAGLARKSLERVNVVFQSLFQDEYFFTLLCSESMASIPDYLLSAVPGGRR